MARGKKVWLGIIVLVAGSWLPRAAVADETTPQAAESGPEETPLQPLRISMDFQDAKLKDVLKTFSQQTGINVITSGSVGDKPVTLYLEGVEVLDALDQILKAGDLTYERPVGSDIYLVKSKEKEVAAGGVAVKTITRVYKLKYARVSESNLAKAATSFGASTPFEASLESSSSGSQSGGSRPTVASGGGAAAVGMGIDSVVKRLLTPAGGLVVDSRTNSLIITDIPGNFQRLEAALAALDVRTPQILVDAEIVETTLSKLKDLGVEWGNGTEGDIFSVRPATRTTYFPFSALAQLLPGNSGLTSGGFAGSGILAKAVPTAGSFQFGSLGSTSALAVLQALETDTDSKILARPKVLTLDNESAVIRLTSNETIGFQSSAQATTGLNTSTPERSLTGIVLVVTPQVNDRQDITMIIEPSVTKTVASTITPPTGQSATRDPKTRSSRTLVRIHNGDTLVVGGLIDRSDEDALRRVPILSSIPVLGEAFKDKHVTHTASELVVFVTPRILDEPSGAQVASVPPPAFGLPAGQAAGGTPSGAAHEQEKAPSRQDLMEETLNRLEEPSAAQ